jgi:hypothetical protein
MDHEILTGVSGLLLMNMGMMVLATVLLFAPIVFGKRLKDDDQD